MRVEQNPPGRTTRSSRCYVF